jgi:hypothetical protein
MCHNVTTYCLVLAQLLAQLLLPQYFDNVSVRVGEGRDRAVRCEVWGQGLLIVGKAKGEWDC